MNEKNPDRRREIPMGDGRRMIATYDSSGELRKTWIEGSALQAQILLTPEIKVDVSRE